MIITEFKMLVKNPAEYRHFVQKRNYESFLLDIINKSGLLGSELQLVNEQFSGEDDYIQLSTSKTFEATLLNNNEIIHRIIKSGNMVWTAELIGWINNEIEKEFINCILRKAHKNRIIVFNIYPFVATKFNGSLTDFCIQDTWDLAISTINKSNPELLKDKEIIVVSFNLDNSFYLKRQIPIDVRYNNIDFVSDYDIDSYIFKMLDLRLVK